MTTSGDRRRGRERAVQALFALDSASVPELAHGLQCFWETVEETDERTRLFTEEIVSGVVGMRSELDVAIQEQSASWRVDRMAKVDRNILRVGAWEILHGGTPAKVAINEAIEIAKTYGSEASPAFVNGILDKLAHVAGRL